MFPSNNVNANIVTTNSKQEELSIPFFHFPSPYSHYELGYLLEDHDPFLHQHHDDLFFHQPLRSSDDSISETVINMPDSSKIDEPIIDCSGSKTGNVITEEVPRKRSSKRDRHSKINTAQGPRDRRMRLSLEVAKAFFGLQDMLGFDKASKTVEWLLLQAKPEIEKLLPHGLSSVRSSSSTSECEVASGIISMKNPTTKDKKITRQPRTLRPLARDLRKKARARAKARTEAKKLQWSIKLDESKQEKIDNLNQIRSWGSFETGEESGTQSHNMNPSLMEAVAEVEVPSSHGRDVVDESLVITFRNSIFNCLQNSGIPQEQQVPDFQAFCKSWEANNNQNLF
ncbi:hypothetical protein SLEP1_g34593 [Rubroshorea leprosula]|uniref:TCP domain-containing protein n=1 Tax=Rubroshorea leprosula TaxID=152421 RepID=A0AAV5KKN2_9ROSI|nr:hypothetical protein SLEP1_g34593 [Rubroshorea leprosula]